jgi:hypothetical protein
MACGSCILGFIDEEIQTMGYTHYYKTSIIPLETWELIVHDIQKIIMTGDWMTKLRHEYGVDEPPTVNSDMICFNGLGDEGHETFLVNRLGCREFCKTARKPYDDVVTASLIVLSKHAPELVKVSSDGCWYEWLPGRNLCRQVLGYTDKDMAGTKEAVWYEPADAQWEAEHSG